MKLDPKCSGMVKVIAKPVKSYVVKKRVKTMKYSEADL